MTQSDELINSISVVRSQLIVDNADFLSHQMDESEYKKLLKERLVKELVFELMDSNYIEFTAEDDITKLCKIYRARLVTIPNHFVTKLRKNGKIV